MKNCRNCRKKDCEFRGVKYENLTIYCGEHCAKELKEECDKIAKEKGFKGLSGYIIYCIEKAGRD